MVREVRTALVMCTMELVCRLQFDTTLKRALALADDIDKKGPDRATDMQVQLTAPLLCCFTVEPLLTAVQGSQVCPEHRHHGQTAPGRTEQTQDAMT